MKRIIILPSEKHKDIFYVKPKYIDEERFTITGSEFHHIQNVLRKKKGDQVTVVDGKGNEYIGIIESIKFDRIIGIISKTLLKPNEPVMEVSIIQGLIKGNRFKYVVEKATEIGVRRIIPVYTEKSIKEHEFKSSQRWENIAISAMKQSGRSILPEITEVRSLKEALEGTERFEAKLIAHSQSGTGIRLFNKNTLSKIKKHKGLIRTAAIAIGPEGGFTTDEVNLARANNFIPISLGDRKLRSETASIVALTILLFSEGELG